MGGGITSNLIVNGHMRETMTSSELGFAAERCGGFSYNDMIDLFLDYDLDIPTIRKLNGGRGGLVSHFGTSDLLWHRKYRLDAPAAPSYGRQCRRPA